jgi:hypothetical protein
LSSAKGCVFVVVRYALRKMNQVATNAAAVRPTINISARRASCDPASAITRTARATMAATKIADIFDGSCPAL